MMLEKELKRKDGEIKEIKDQILDQYRSLSDNEGASSPHSRKNLEVDSYKRKLEAQT
jgi:hypothetical protein